MNDPAMVEAVLARVPGAGRAFIAFHNAFVRKTVLRASPAVASLVDDLTHDVPASSGWPLSPAHRPNRLLAERHSRWTGL